MKIAFVVNPVAGGWDPANAETWGGGEEVAVLATDAIARRGHDVTVFYDGAAASRVVPATPGATIRYLPRSEGPAYSGTFDAAIFLKCHELGAWRLAARQFLWTDQERPIDPDHFERVFACSEYLGRVLASLSPRGAVRLDVMTYAIDRARYAKPEGSGPERDPQLVLHTASPDRGLEEFLEIWRAVEPRVPGARLVCTYGWELYDKCGGDPVRKRRILARLQECERAEMARVDADTLRELYQTAGVWAYFCTGGEQFCLSALKAQTAGAVPLVRKWGAMHETVRGGACADTADGLAQALEALLTDPALQTQLRQDLRPERWVPDWADVAARWDDVWSGATAPEVRALESHVLEVPGAPPFDKPAGWNLDNVLRPVVASWMGAVRPKRPWISPTLGLPMGPAADPHDADAVVLGFEAEDATTPFHETLRALGCKPGTPMLCITSTGTWRAGKRRRVLYHQDLVEILGKQPNLNIQSASLDMKQNGVLASAWHLAVDRLGQRDLGRVLRQQAPQQTLSVCIMARDVADEIPVMLRSIEDVADELVVADNGSTDATPELLHAWSKRTGIPVQIVAATSPRWCYDCQREHAKGEMGYGHRVAGFETARNQSVVPARGDWILWLDCDEELLHGENLRKYLRPSVFQGFSVQQHHATVQPATAAKVDLPVRLFRRTVDPTQTPGLFDYGPLRWPTVNTGLTARFTGVVHEHPGFGPEYTEGLGPAIVIADAFLAHGGYFTEEQRRLRFVRNWPLMVADRQKYPMRRLGRFLWLRDFAHHVQDMANRNGGHLTPQAAAMAEECWDIWRTHFVDRTDPYVNEAMGYASSAAQAMGRGFQVEAKIVLRKPEVSGDEAVGLEFTGRFENREDLLKCLTARLADAQRWEGEYL